MTWVIPVAIGAAQIQQQGAIGKTNQAIQNRNAQVFKQEGDAIEQQAEKQNFKFNFIFSYF